MTKRTRAELIEGLSLLQMNRLETYQYRNEKDQEEYMQRKYWVYHNKNAKLSTQKLKYRIAKEVYWKVQSDRI